MVVDPASARSTPARVLGRIAVIVVVVVVVAGVSAFWNPWRLVVVERVIAVPAVAIVMAVVFGCAFALLPVPAGSTSEFTVGKRVFAAIAVPVMSLQMWATAVPGWPTERHRELARSPGGDRVVAHRSSTGGQCLSVWAGRGLGARVAGALGDPGDEPTVTFDRRDLVVVSGVRPPTGALRRTTFELRLDPATGRPLDALPERC